MKSHQVERALARALCHIPRALGCAFSDVARTAADLFTRPGTMFRLLCLSPGARQRSQDQQGILHNNVRRANGQKVHVNPFSHTINWSERSTLCACQPYVPVFSVSLAL